MGGKRILQLKEIQKEDGLVYRVLKCSGKGLCTKAEDAMQVEKVERKLPRWGGAMLCAEVRKRAYYEDGLRSIYSRPFRSRC